MMTLVYSVAKCACMTAIYSDTNIVESEYIRSVHAGRRLPPLNPCYPNYFR